LKAVVQPLRKKGKMVMRIWSRPLGVTDLAGPDYWDYFGDRLVTHAAIHPGANVLDIGCGTGSSLFPAARQTGGLGYVTGIDICPG
jgi:O-methyltransferase/aklanonic acid methyltransferase